MRTRNEQRETALVQSTRTTPSVPVPVPARAPRPGRVRPAAPDYPSRAHRLLPPAVRNLMAGLGWWQNPLPLPPSSHLEQTLAVLERYGWGKSLDFSPTGRMCIRGAQTLLGYTGHVTPHARHRAVAFMQHTLAQDGTDMPFFAWNDLPERTWPQVENLLVTAAHTARTRGE